MTPSEAGKLGYAIARGQLLARTDRIKEAYEKSPKKCLGCETVLPYENRRNTYCGRSCSAKHNNTKRMSKRCLTCSGLIRKHRQYCRPCGQLRIKFKTSILEAESDHTRRKILLRQRGYRCEGCGLTEWLGNTIPLQLDHISGDSDDNREENLRLLCPNCHALTPTYMGRNMKKHNTMRNRLRRSRYRSTNPMPQ